MIEIFYGDNRVAAQLEIKKILGPQYEVIDGPDIDAADLPSIFLGSSLFAQQRQILIKDLSLNKEAWEMLPQYLATDHKVIVWEQSLRKNTKIYKALQKADIKIREFKNREMVDTRIVFQVMDAAWTDGNKAIKMLEKIENDQDPYMFVGLLVTQVLKRYEQSPNAKNKHVLKELAKLDMQLKTTKFANQPWSLIKAFLLRVANMK